MASVLLSNIEYSFLYNEGGDGLVTFFATLRYCKKSAVIKKVGKKGPIALIGFVTGLSRTIINKHFPTLLEIGMVQVHPNGNIAVRGRNWTNKNLPRQINRKLIPITICEKFTLTKTRVAYVRVHSNLKRQKSQIGKKAEQIKVLREELSGATQSLKNHHAATHLVRKGLDLQILVQNSCLNSTISNHGFYKLLKNNELHSENTKRTGQYFKRMLLKQRLIIQQRDVRLVSRVKSIHGLEQLRESEKYGGYFLGRSGIYYEFSPRIEFGNAPLVGNKKKQVKK